jgi:hypothetical protein
MISIQDGRQAKNWKRGDEIKKKSSPLKLQSQFQPNFAEMILGWSPSKIVSGISDLRPRWLPQLLLSKWFQTRIFLWEFPIGFYVNLSSAVAASLVGVLKCRTQIWKRTTQSEIICSIRTTFWWSSHWMVLFQKCVRRFGPSTKMAPTAELSWKSGSPDKFW